MNIGDKVIIKREICANDMRNPHYNKIGTVIKEADRLGLIEISINDFPNCNHREYHNRFYFSIEELEIIKND